jgi:hypothetical protein
VRTDKTKRTAANVYDHVACRPLKPIIDGPIASRITKT